MSRPVRFRPEAEAEALETREWYEQRTRTPVQSMGGIRVVPSTTVTEIDPSDVAVFILPGGDRWETAPIEAEIEELLKRLDAEQVPSSRVCPHGRPVVLRITRREIEKNFQRI